MATTELVALRKEVSDDPRFAVCFARGAVFRPEGNFHRVEKGQRTLVHRVLCVAEHYKERCKSCPNRDFTATFRAP